MSDRHKRYFLDTAKKFFADAVESSPAPAPDPADDFPRLTPNVLERTRMTRPRDRIMESLDKMYREAFERAKASGDESQMATLDFAYVREQLYFEILLDIRAALEKRA